MAGDKPRVYECDVLVMGGGIGGLMAAIAVAQAGKKVIVAEKSDSRRSGSGATGNDHFVCYIPGVHGEFENYMREMRMTQAGINGDEDILRAFARRSAEVAESWHDWGINMKTGPGGTWAFEGHAFPGRMRTHLKYDGRAQKMILTDKALACGVIIENKSPVTDFLTDDTGRICGALALDVSRSQPSFKLFCAGSVITAAGSGNRIYSSSTPAWMFNVAGCPSCTGEGIAASYRVGASLINMETPRVPAGPKYFARAGKGSWIGVLRDYRGKNIGPFVDKPSRENGDITSDVWPGVFREMQETGHGPVYMDCSQLSPEDSKYLLWALTCEGGTSLVEAMETQGVDLSRDMVEFGSYESTLLGVGIETDSLARTRVPGLYAAGDHVGNFCATISGAAVMGRIAGEHAAANPGDPPGAGQLVHHPAVEERLEFCRGLMERGHGFGWKELNIAVNQIMDDYASVFGVRSETRLLAGLRYLELVGKRAGQGIACNSSHELMRALEAFGILSLARPIFLSALGRRETRGLHRRSDFTFTNPLMDTVSMTVRLDEGSELVETRTSPRTGAGMEELWKK